MNDTGAKEIEMSMPRILRNRSRSFNVESNEPKNITIESAIERIQKNDSPVATEENSEQINENKIMGENVRKRKQEICIQVLNNEDLDWIRCVPKKMREEESKNDEAADNVDVVVNFEPSFEDFSLDFWTIENDNWTNVQSIVEIETEKIEEIIVDDDEDESLIVPVSSASASIEFSSTNGNESIDIESLIGDKSQIDLIDLDINDDGDHFVEEKKKPFSSHGIKIKKKEGINNDHTFSQGNSEPETTVETNFYHCKICDKKYRQKFSLYRHQKKIHDYVDV